MSIGTLLGVALFTAVGTLLLRRYNETYALILAAAGGCFLLLGSVGMITRIQEYITSLLSQGGISGEWFSLLFKVMGICYLCQFGADLCRDAGETAMAGYVELVGKIMTVMLSLPMVGELAKTVIEWINV